MNHKNKKRTIFLLTFFLCLFICAGMLQAKESKEVEIVFTHDLHSHINSFSTVYDGKDTNIGGFARIETIIKEKRKDNPGLLVVDGGDFSMGTLFQTVFTTQASELRLLGEMGYDATTFGNHEFDYRSDGLNQMLYTAKNSGDVLPALLLCNVDFSDENEVQKSVHDAFDAYGVKKYVVVEKNGMKIALLGVFGKDALACAPTCDLTFTDPVTAVKDTVAEIEKNEQADMIVCLSHCGTSENAKKSEDEILAQKVPELDLIISGHSHTLLEEPIVYGDTSIVSCGEYGKNVGTLTMERKEDGRFRITDYELIPTTADIAEDAQTAQSIRAYEKTIDTDYLAQFGYTSDQVLAHNTCAFDTVEDLYQTHTEHNLGDIMSDAYVYGVDHASTGDDHPVDVAIVPSGTVRDTYVTGDITVSDVFNSFSLGIGEDKIPGYPLISVYLSGKELRTVAEIDASISDLMQTARLYMSGLNFTYNPHRLILNRVTDVYLTDTDGSRIEIENDKLYRVVADLYSGQMLSAVTDMSKGLLSIVPKNADGTPVEDYADCIVMDGTKELKAWAAIASYLESFPENESGVAEVPEYYSQMHDRKVVEDKTDPVSRISHPNKYAVLIVAAVVVLTALLITVIFVICRIVRKIWRKRKK